MKVHLNWNGIPSCGNRGQGLPLTRDPSAVTCVACKGTFRMAIRELELQFAPRRVPQHLVDRIRKRTVARWRREGSGK